MYGESAKHKEKTIFFCLESELPYNINLDPVPHEESDPKIDCAAGRGLLPLAELRICLFFTLLIELFSVFIVGLLQGLGLVYFIKMNGLCVLHNSTPDVMHVKSGDTDYNW
jgi:hypothetical protein